MKRILFLQVIVVLVFILGWSNSSLAQDDNTVTLSAPQQDQEFYDNKALEEIHILPGYDFLTGQLLEDNASWTNPRMHAHIDFSIIGPEQSGGVLSDSDFDTSIDTSKPVGSISGNAAVSSSGGALYSVPIVLPKGTSSMEPTVSLSYNSQSGNGVLGMGWNLGATSSITLAPKNIYNDGEVKGIQFDGNDKFALDGNRLMLINGVYGEHNSEYKTESETYVKVKLIDENANGIIDYFVVWTKDGNILTYGESNSSRFFLDGNSVLSWKLSKVEDAYGNYFEYFYINENHEHRLDEIKYTGNTEAGLTPYNRIQFHYIERQDKNTSYLNGKMINSNILLDFIDIRSQDNLYKKYTFDYGYKDNKTFLNSITESGADGSDINPLKFKYNSKNANGNTITQGINGLPSNGNNDNIYGDFNGDGKTDYVTFTNYELWGVKFNTSWSLRINDGDGSFNTEATATLNHVDDEDNFEFYTILSDYHGSMVADFNGDGMMDFAVVKLMRSNEEVYEIQKVSFFISTGTGFNEIIYNNIPDGWTIFEDDNLSDFIWFGDFDGNGASDMILNIFLIENMAASDIYTVFYSPSTGEEKLQQNDNGVPFYLDFGVILDFNGDGKSDLIKIHDNVFGVFSITDPTNQTSLAWNPICSGIVPGGISGENINKLQIGDFNGDGNSDILIDDHWNGKAYIGFSNGNNAFDFEEVDTGIHDNLNAIDFDGDGKTDIISITNQSEWTGATYDHFLLETDPCTVGIQWVVFDYNIPVKTIVGHKVYTDHINLGVFRSKNYSIEEGYTYQYNNYIISDPVNTPYVSDFYSLPYYSYTPITISSPPDYIPEIFNLAYYHENFVGQPFVSPYDENVSLNELNSSLNYTYSPDAKARGFDNVWKLYDLEGGILDCVNEKITDHNDTQTNSIIQANEYFTAEPIYNKYNISAVTDIDGDGIVELSFSNCSKLFYYTPNQNHYALKKVKNGMGITTEFEYEPLTNPEVYAKGNSAIFPKVDMQLSLYVVSEIKTDIQGGFNMTKYKYEEALVHQQGRGFLGFLKTYNTNFITASPERALMTITTSDYDDTYLVPFVEKKEVFRIDDINEPFSSTEDNLVSSLENTAVNFFDIGNGRFKSEINTTIAKTYYQGNQTSNKVTSITYDTNGNLTNKTENINGGYQISTITNTYSSFGNWWIPSKVATTTVSSTRLGYPAISSSKNYGYNDDGSLASKTDNSGTSQEVTTEYQYDNLFGLPSSTMITTSGEEPRITTVEYDAKGRITKTINELNQESVITYSPIWSTPISKTDITGLTTNYEYNEWGKLIETIEPNGKTKYTETHWINESEYVTTIASNVAPTTTTKHNKFGYEISSSVDNYTSTVVKSTTYNNFGQINTSSEPHFDGETYGITTVAYDDYGRPSISTFTSGSLNLITTNNYKWVTETWDDGTYFEGWKITVDKPDGTTITYKDITDLVLKVVDETGAEIVYKYFSDGQLQQVIIDDQITNNFLYDQVGNQTELFDFNSGPTNYTYNNFGQLVHQEDYLGNEFDIEYDLMGRITTKTGMVDNIEQTYSYEYTAQTNGLNSLKKVTAPNGNYTEYTYGDFNRVMSITENIDGIDYVTSFEYDNYGRIIRKVYPGSGFAIRNVYTSDGFLSAVLTDDYATTIWSAGAQNAKGIYTTFALGNGCITTQEYDKIGMPTSIITTNNLNDEIQNLEMEWSADNPYNLDFRQDNVKLKNETFDYEYNRLISYEVTSLEPVPITYPVMTTEYSTNGNIIQKTDAGGPYLYLAQPHAVRSVSNPNHIISHAPQGMSYTNFNSLESITQSGGSLLLDLTYGADQQRRKQVITNNDLITKINYYVGQYEKEEEFAEGTLTITREVNYISSPSGICAMWVVKNGLGSMYYLHKDHLGSIVTVTDASGTVEFEQNFDPWGRYRNPVTWEYLNQGQLEDFTLGEDFIPDWVSEIANTEWAWFRRGFTGHEMLPEFGIINMNGRCYDPVLGRMLQVDNYVQNPFSSQSYNRYTYTMNNPLRYTDPSGETWWDVVAGVSIVAGVILFPANPGIGGALIGAGIAHFGNTLMGVINQGQSWSQASKNAGFTVSASFTTSWGYSNQQPAPNPAYSGGGGGSSVAMSMTPSHSMAGSWNLYASTSPEWDWETVDVWGYPADPKESMLYIGDQESSSWLADWWTNFSSDGIFTFEVTGTAALFLGLDKSYGVAIDFRGNNIKHEFYKTENIAYGVDLSFGFNVLKHTPYDNESFNISNLYGKGEQSTLGFFPIDLTWGDDSYYTNGLGPESWSSHHSIYKTRGIGFSAGTPLGYTYTKGVTSPWESFNNFENWLLKW